MSKELEYVQRQIDIVKQQVKGSKMKIIVTDTFTKHQYDYYEKELQILESIESGLKRLEAIDNAEPSEALECLENIESDLTGLHKHTTEYDDGFDSYLEDIWNNIATIKQALLKAQEPKQYLKWEDLEFADKIKTLWVKLGDNAYKMQYYKWSELANKVVIFSAQFIEIYDKQFFNDLRLERVEE